jgi:ribonuclease BN (tRNA processing enzyme)
MRMTVLGGCGAWPAAGQACSGYLVERDGFRLLVDPGYATVPRLLALVQPEQVDAVFVSHAHPDHCADLSPLLRARTLAAEPPPRLPVYSLAGAVDAVLALDPPRMGADGCTLHPLTPGAALEIGPFRAQTRLLPHSVPNLGLRLSAGGTVLAYTGDAAPHPDMVALADNAALLLAEASFPERLPTANIGNLSTAGEAGEQATAAGVGRLLLTHLLPGADEQAALAAARHTYTGPVDLAVGSGPIDLDRPL